MAGHSTIAHGERCSMPWTEFSTTQQAHPPLAPPAQRNGHGTKRRHVFGHNCRQAPVAFSPAEPTLSCPSILSASILLSSHSRARVSTYVAGPQSCLGLRNQSSCPRQLVICARALPCLIMCAQAPSGVIVSSKVTPCVSRKGMMPQRPLQASSPGSPPQPPAPSPPPPPLRVLSSSPPGRHPGAPQTGGDGGGEVRVCLRWPRRQ